MSALVLLHKVTCRQNLNSGARQASLIRLILLLNLGSVGLIFLVIVCVEPKRLVGVSDALYIVLTFNLIAYTYFHIFNLSETGRRIRILNALTEGEVRQLIELKSYYSPEDMISKRLERLVSMGHLEYDQGAGYVIQKKWLLWIALSFKRLRKLVYGYGIDTSRS